jgi:hypothetical protein
MFVSNPAQFLDSADVSRRIADAFTEDGMCLVIDEPLDRRRMVTLRESNSYSLAKKNVSKESVRSSVKLGTETILHPNTVTFRTA